MTSNYTATDRQRNILKYPLPASPPTLSPLYFLFLIGLEDKFSKPDKQRESKVRDIAASVVHKKLIVIVTLSEYVRK